jgi:hypothetical protein
MSASTLRYVKAVEVRKSNASAFLVRSRSAAAKPSRYLKRATRVRVR